MSLKTLIGRPLSDDLKLKNYLKSDDVFCLDSSDSMATSNNLTVSISQYSVFRSEKRFIVRKVTKLSKSARFLR